MNINRKLSEEELYKVAEKRVHLKRDLITHIVVYLTVNIFLLFVNLFTSRGYLWCLWVVFGWGIGVATHIVDTYMKLNMDSGAVQKEVERLKNKGF